MRSWLKGKRGGLIAYLLIVTLVIGGLSGVTALALNLEQDAQRLEREQRRARLQAERDAKLQAEYYSRMRLALWMLDSSLLPILAHEGNRPYYQYTPVFKPRYALVKQGDQWKPASVLQPSPLLNEELPDWMLIHFQVDESAHWDSPQVFQSDEDRSAAHQNEIDVNNVTQTRERLLAWLRRTWKPQALFVRLDQQQRRLLATYEAHGNLRNSNLPSDPGNKQNPLLSFQPNPQVLEREYLYRLWQQRNQIGVYGGQGQGVSQGKDQENSKPPPAEPSAVRIGPLSAMWLAADDGGAHLVLARSVELEGKKKLYQGILLDLPRLKEFLLPAVADIFPGADLRPLTDETPSLPERSMTALPLELVPGEPASGAAELEPLEEPADSPQGILPLHVGLLIAWSAAILALVAVGWGGHALIDHSERRMRFVSAVTHELRTPLTTLRLYLDMLTGGMVRDEGRRAEYLATLNQETDRLNRLVSHVLDFARLEDRSPRVENRPLDAAAFLSRVHSSWFERCRAADKELVVEDRLPADVSLVSDAAILEQLLGNLIDNACKYGKPAVDPRIWLRVHAADNRVLLEVEDRGPGVPADERRSIFTAFRQGKNAEMSAAGGVGLGLALAARWARLLGGELTLDSPPAGGARFRLALPLFRRQEAPPGFEPGNG